MKKEMMKERVDYLNREKFLDDLTEIVECISKSKKGCTFAIDGKWGCGKSFLLDMFEKKVSVIQTEEFADDRYFIVRYDCWKYTYYSEPILALIAAIVEQVSNAASIFGEVGSMPVVRGATQKLKEYLEACGGKLLESRLGFDPVALYKESYNAGKATIEDERKYDSYATMKDVLESLRGELEKIAATKTIILIVDELDRCLPEYAIKIMESLHHVFHGIPNFITILAVDRKALKKVIKRAYGKKTKASAYMKKILDFYLDLGVGELSPAYLEKYDEYVKQFEGAESDLRWVQDVVNHMMCGIDIRTQEQIMSKAALIHSIISEGIMDYSALAFEVVLLCMKNMYRNIPLKEAMLIVEGKEGSYDVESQAEAVRMILDKRSYTRWVIKSAKQYEVLDDSIENRLKWYIENLSSKAAEEICGDYYCEEYEKYQGCVEKMKLFAYLAGLIE